MPLNVGQGEVPLKVGQGEGDGNLSQALDVRVGGAAAAMSRLLFELGVVQGE